MNIAGFSLSNWMTYGFSFLEGSIAWRFPIAFQLVFSFILFATIPWLPESPRWLLAHGYEEEGINVLVALEGNGITSQDDFIIDQKEEILEAVRIEKETAPSWSDIIRGKTGNTGMIQRLVLGAGLYFDRHILRCLLMILNFEYRYPMDATTCWNKRHKLLVRHFSISLRYLGLFLA